MFTYSQEKVVASRSLSSYLFENAGLFLGLVKLFISNKISFSFANLLLRANGISKNFVAVIEDISREAITSQQDTQKDLTLLGFRVFTLKAVVTRESIEAAYGEPYRDQFFLVSALLDGCGKYSFIHKVTDFSEPKAKFKTALINSREALCNAIKENLQISLQNNELWEKNSVHDIVRRMMYVVFAKTLLGIDQEDILQVYEPLAQSLDEFENMWQHPDQLNPFDMFMLYQRLETISNQLHERRRAAALLDDFASSYGRSMNMAAIFLVAANLVHFMTAAILHQCTKGIGPELTDTQLDDIAREIATWRFRDSRIYRFNSRLFDGSQICPPRSLTVIPQGDINHDRIIKQELLDEEGRVK